ncbi:hypothetical protein SBRCBS47491_006744 [Sporothrix bragantina]|uniref:DUF4211 domain-containing protein n=1 Tax=Sporothrix bragantina TaxID=671064 RepID=A0ABP0C7G0_9PEZI
MPSAARAAQFRESVPPHLARSNVRVRVAEAKDGRGVDYDLPVGKVKRKGTFFGAGSSQSPAQARRGIVIESSDDDKEDSESDGTDDTDDTLPKRPQARIRSKSRRAALGDSDEDDAGNEEGEDEEEEDDDDDDDDVRPAKRRRRERKPAVDSEESSGDDLVILTLSPKNTPSRLVRSTPAQQQQQPASSVSRSARKSGARSVKQRHLELLRRRRLGEKVTESDLDESLSEDEQPRVALYDKDPDHVALSDFEDDEEEEPAVIDNDVEDDEEEPVSAEQMEKDKKLKWKKDKKKEKKEKRRKAEKEQAQISDTMQLRSKFDEESDDGYGVLSGGEDGDGGEQDEEAEDMADFIDDSHTGLIGAPDSLTAEDEQAMLRREIPLQFTFQAHKPLKSHFKDAVEWLVHRRVNPGGAFAESDDELYRVAWDRLDREVGGLAQSRFISSVWTPEFYSTLRARPYMDSFNIRPSGGSKNAIVIPGMDENVCHACGRTNHPASYRVMFSGKAYDSKTLDDIEEADSDNEDDEDEDNDYESVDMNGNALPPTSKQWYVGAVCHSNAETAHDLLHWRRALKDWVEEKLKADKLLDQLDGRKKKMKTRKRRAFANKIVDDWEANGTVTSLFRDFSKMLEGAQAKSTKTFSRFGR